MRKRKRVANKGSDQAILRQSAVRRFLAVKQFESLRENRIATNKYQYLLLLMIIYL